MVTGFAAGAAQGYIAAHSAGRNPWTGESLSPKSVPGSYAPEQPLSRTKHGLPKVDQESIGKPHTQLGTKSGRRGSYTQAREFDAAGNPVRDIDFTDHGRPSNHPNPHQHFYKMSETGGTFQRLKEAVPVPFLD